MRHNTLDLTLEEILFHNLQGPGIITLDLIDWECWNLFNTVAYCIM